MSWMAGCILFGWTGSSGGGSSVTADNLLTASSNNVQLGGTGIQDTDLDANGFSVRWHSSSTEIMYSHFSGLSIFGATNATDYTAVGVTKLAVHNAGYSYIQVTNATTGQAGVVGGYIGFDTGKSVFNIYNASGNVNIGTIPSSTIITFTVAGSEKVRITEDPYFGINQPTPSATLDVGGSAKISLSLAVASTLLTADVATGQVGVGNGGYGSYKFAVTGDIHVSTNIDIEQKLRFASSGFTYITGDGATVTVGTSGGFAISKFNLLVNYYSLVVSSTIGNFHSFETTMLQVKSAGSSDSTQGVMINAATIDASAIFQIDSTTLGVLLPRMTTAQRDAIASPATGLLIYNTDTTTLDAYNGVTWAPV